MDGSAGQGRSYSHLLGGVTGSGLPPANGAFSAPARRRPACAAQGRPSNASRAPSEAWARRRCCQPSPCHLTAPCHSQGEGEEEDAGKKKRKKRRSQKAAESSAANAKVKSFGTEVRSPLNSAALPRTPPLRRDLPASPLHLRLPLRRSYPDLPRASGAPPLRWRKRWNVGAQSSSRNALRRCGAAGTARSPSRRADRLLLRSLSAT